MTSTKLTLEGRERLQAALRDARQDLLQTEDFIRQQMLCKCDLDPVSLQEARERKAALEHQIDGLESTLADAEILPEDRTTSTVELGAFVALVQEPPGEEIFVQVVAAADAAVAEGHVARISDASPLGQRLLGRRAGDAIRVPLGEGREARYRVKRVRY